MKFAHQLQLEESFAPKEMQGQFLQYKVLKKMLKRRSLASSAADDSPRSRNSRSLATEKEFLKLLRCQLIQIDKKFGMDAEAILAQYNRVGASSKRTILGGLFNCILTNCQKETESLTKLQKKVFWTVKYAQLNATALRKIAKKHDKLCGGKLGEGFVQVRNSTTGLTIKISGMMMDLHVVSGSICLQACFRGNVAVHSLLSAPLLYELAAVNQLLEQQLASATVPTAVAASTQCLQMQCSRSCSSDTIERILRDGSEPEKEYTCAICLDVLYKPVALECGHIYCARCALNTAVGHDRTVGDAENLLYTIAAYSAAHANRACPACRSTVHGNERESVFWQIKVLPNLDALIQQRYSEQWQHKKAEDDEQQAALRKERAEKCIIHRSLAAFKP